MVGKKNLKNLKTGFGNDSRKQRSASVGRKGRGGRGKGEGTKNYTMSGSALKQDQVNLFGVVIPPPECLRGRLPYTRPIPEERLPPYLEKEMDLNQFPFLTLLLGLSEEKRYRKLFECRIIRHRLLQRSDISRESMVYMRLLLHFMVLGERIFQDEPDTVVRMKRIFSRWNDPFKLLYTNHKRFKEKYLRKNQIGEESRKRSVSDKPSSPHITSTKSIEKQPQKPELIKQTENKRPKLNPRNSRASKVPKLTLPDTIPGLKEKAKRYNIYYKKGFINYKKFETKVRHLLKNIHSVSLKFEICLEAGNVFIEKGLIKEGNRYLRKAIRFQKSIAFTPKESVSKSEPKLEVDRTNKEHEICSW